jgi:hypothetical protein
MPGFFAGPGPDGKLTIRRVFPGSGAEKADLKEGDVVVAVDGRSLGEIGFGAANFLMMGKPGTEAQVTVTRGGAEPRVLTLKREPPPNMRPPGAPSPAPAGAAPSAPVAKAPGAAAPAQAPRTAPASGAAASAPAPAP